MSLHLLLLKSSMVPQSPTHSISLTHTLHPDCDIQQNKRKYLLEWQKSIFVEIQTRNGKSDLWKAEIFAVDSKALQK